MKRWLYRFPINVTLPLLLLATLLILAGLYMVALLHGQQEAIRINSERELTNEISRMQRLGQYLIDRRDTARLQEEIASFGPDIRVSAAFVLDENGRVLASLDRLHRGKPLLNALDMAGHAHLHRTVLDEIDAPLDDANIGRFTGMLEQFLEFSQFVIITHNKRTISVADTIYGVTMQEKGVSRMISMRFNKATGRAEAAEA